MKIFISSLILILSFCIKSQNYIYNFDFETADGGNSWPTAVAQADKMTSWETRTFSTGSTDLHSPDWINLNGTGVQTIKGVHPGTHTGSGMIGMTNYELIQQQFNNQAMDGETYHTISMWVYMPSPESKNCRLRIMFAQNKLKYDDESIIPAQQNLSDLCTEKYTQFSNLLSSWTTICEFDFNSLNIPYNSWQKISYTFKTPSNNIMGNYSYFGMELRKNGYDPGVLVSPCQDSYIFIDDLSLVKSDFCNAACAPNLEAITHGTFQNAMLVLGVPFNVIFQNAIGIEFRLFNSWGSQIAFVDAFDPNGLKDSGYSDYQFLWSGADANSNPLFPQGVYNYTLRYWNCKEDNTYTNSLTYLPTNNGGQAQHPNNHIYDLIDCCPNERYIQNTTYIGDYIHTAKNNIWAGDHVTNSQPFGSVIINSGVSVKYIAKNISIQSGFFVQQGATFKAIPTEDCIYQPVQRVAQKERYVSDNILFNQILPNEDKNVLVYPNPSAKIFTIKSTKEEIESIEIYNQYGQKILSYNKYEFKSLIDLDNHASGTYFYKATLKNGNISRGKLMKSN